MDQNQIELLLRVRQCADRFTDCLDDFNLECETCQNLLRQLNNALFDSRDIEPKLTSFDVRHYQYFRDGIKNEDLSE